jgi:hypothetical protein
MSLLPVQEIKHDAQHYLEGLDNANSIEDGYMTSPVSACEFGDFLNADGAAMGDWTEPLDGGCRAYPAGRRSAS